MVRSLVRCDEADGRVRSGQLGSGVRLAGLPSRMRGHSGLLCDGVDVHDVRSA